MNVGTVKDATTRPFTPLKQQHDPESFRREVRAWLEATVPLDWRQRMKGARSEEFMDFQRWWLQEMRKVGLATPHWPSEWGGEQLSLRNQIIVSEETARVDAPTPEMFSISLYHLPATLFAFGTEEQRDQYLRGVKEGRDIWCQGFSEPGAGSDLASLRTRAERRGDVYVINGQKIWSSFGMYADYCLLLARTDSAAPKHAGISYFILDMKSPGVTINPIRQITGEAEFASMFLDDVEIPARNLIGKENDGWRIAQTTLSAERGLFIFNLIEKLERALNRDLTAGNSTWFGDDQLRREFSLLYARMRGVRAMVRKMLAEIESNPDMAASMMTTFIKLVWATLLQDYTEFVLRAEGIDGQALEPPIWGGGHNTGLRMNDFLRSYAWTISGGTNEIMRNIIAERVLGMPKGV